MADDIKNVYQLSFSGKTVNDILVKADGLGPASSSVLGLVSPDGITITASDGIITSHGLKKDRIENALLASDGWNINKQQDINNDKITASADLIVAPAPDSLSAYSTYGVYCASQSAGVLTFSYTSENTINVPINVNILIFE